MYGWRAEPMQNRVPQRTRVCACEKKVERKVDAWARHHSDTLRTSKLDVNMESGQCRKKKTRSQRVGLNGL